MDEVSQWETETIRFPAVFKISSFMFHWIKKVIQVWNNTRVRKGSQNFNFWVDCLFNGLSDWLPLPTGTFCALDICLSQLQDVGTLNICQTVRRMRAQRAFSIQTPEQYYFCHTAILEHAQRQGLLSANQWAAGPIRCQSETKKV